MSDRCPMVRASVCVGVMVFLAACAGRSGGVAGLSRGGSAPSAEAPTQHTPVVRTPMELIEQDRLMATLRSLPTKRAAKGDAAHRQGLRDTEELLIARLREMGCEPIVHELASDDGKSAKNGRSATPGTADEHPWRNVIVDFPGTDLKDEVLLLGAHFDAVPGAPGADDNGSGTSALVEIARAYQALRAQGWTTRKTIRLAFFNLEEIGMVGSTRYFRDFSMANKPAEASETPSAGRQRIVSMVSLEMLGYYSDAPGSQRSPFPKIEGKFDPPTVGDSIVIVSLAKHTNFARGLERAMVASEPGAKVFVADFSPIPLPDLMRSDHAAFALAGVPAAMLTDTANFRNPNYHKASDTIDTIDARRFTLTTKAIAGAWWSLAEPIEPSAELNSKGSKGSK